MPLSFPDRIRSQTPHIVDLWRALAPLKSCVSFMNTGAHPDDETSAMLAALGFRDGFDLSYACSTRGEGGQNAIGRESGEALGALRTAEMERAAEALNLRLYWLGDSAADPITDFGFSKSGDETLEKWGRARTLARFVHILRRERPDIICPTFLDVPGQHGHHRAMTEAAHLMMDLAADPQFDGSDLAPWQVKKLYLPAWSGAGQAYDDDLPPPPATLTVAARGVDPVTGHSWEQIGQQSRGFHATQGMGHWVPPGRERDWSLHLADCRLPDHDSSSDHRVSDGLPADLRCLAGFAGAPELEADLVGAQDAIDAAISAFPDGAAILPHAMEALRLVEAAESACPATAKSEVRHRLTRKRTQLARVIRIAAGVDLRGYLSADWLHPGETVGLAVETRKGTADNLSIALTLPDGWTVDKAHVTPGADAAPHDAWRDTYLPDAPAAPALRASVTIGGVTSVSHIALEVPPVLLPARAATLVPQTAIVNRASGTRTLNITLSDATPEDATATLDLPQGWHAAPRPGGFTLTLPVDVPEGFYTLPLLLDGAPAQSVQRIAHAHIHPAALLSPAEVKVRVLDVALPDVRVAYFGGGGDRVDHWLAALGLDVTCPDPENLSDAALAAFDTIVIGIFALKQRAGLAALMPRLHEWVENGGTLVTLYHRPWDNWDPAQTPPRMLEIGQPSLRWRVTDERAEVTHLTDHPVLSAPNPIGPETWEGWHKERGLYFAKAWDPAYVPLLSMADPGEAPLSGGLLSADIGAGRHTHCALILHHQMERLVPGAFALMANMLARRAPRD